MCHAKKRKSCKYKGKPRWHEISYKGEQLKVLQIIEVEKKRANNFVQVVDVIDSKQNEKEQGKR